MFNVTQADTEEEDDDTCSSPVPPHMQQSELLGC